MFNKSKSRLLTILTVVGTVAGLAASALSVWSFLRRPSATEPSLPDLSMREPTSGTAEVPSVRPLSPTDHASVLTSKKTKNSSLVDINSTSIADLIALPGVGQAYAQHIIDNRPYLRKSELKSRNIIPESTYQGMSTLIIAKQKT